MEHFKDRFDISRFFLVFSLSLFLLGTLTKLSIPLAEWDYVYIDAAQQWAQGINKEWRIDHPPLYPFFLTILFKFFGSNIIVARLGNIFCILLTGLVLFRMTSILFNRDAAFWTITFYFLSPACIQGVVSMDVADTSILPLAFVFTTYAIINNTLRPCLKNTGILSLGVGFCFWAKVTSTIALISSILGCIILYLIIYRKERTRYKGWLLNTCGIVAGLLFFLLTWVLVSYSLWGREACIFVLQAPWYSLLSQNVVKLKLSLKIIQVIRDAILIFVWLSPYFIITWIYGSLTLVKLTYKNASDQVHIIFLLAGVCVLYFTGYLLIGGTNYGFPRYHAALLPLMCLFVGTSVAKFIREMDNKTLIVLNLNLLFLILFFIIFSKDPLCFLNMQLKEMLLSNASFESLAKHSFFIFLLLYGLPIISTLIINFSRHIHKHRMFVICLFIGSLSTMISLNIQHLVAPYRTSTEYGANGKIELIQTVRNHIQDGDYILATPEFTYDLRDRKIPYVGLQVWGSRENIHEFILNKKPSAIIAGITVNTYEQLKCLLSTDTQGTLIKDYTFERIGTYYLWIRKSAMRHRIVG